MKTILAIFGIIFLGIMFMIALVALLIWRKFRKIQQYIGSHPMPPSELHLLEDSNPRWTEHRLIKNMIADLEEIGFIRGKAYLIKELSDLKLLSLFITDPSVCVMIYHQQQTGSWVDLQVQYEDNTFLSVSNAPLMGRLNYPPYYKRIVNTKADITELCRITLGSIDSKPIVHIDNQNFQEYYEKNFKRDMEWRIQQMGVTVEAMNRQEGADDFRFNQDFDSNYDKDENLQQIYSWHEDCLENFLNQANDNELTAAYHDDMLFIISESMDQEAMIEYLETYLKLSSHAEQLHTMLQNIHPVTDLFAAINRLEPLEYGVVKVGSVSQPIVADIYRIFPEDSEE